MGSLKGKKVDLSMSASTDLAADLGRGDAQIIAGRKAIPTIVDGYQNAVTIYQSVVSSADKYIVMAKALGETEIQQSLEKRKKDALDMIKLSQAAITKLKSI